MFDLEEFINTYVTRRSSSMFETDEESHRAELEKMIEGKSVLVIGGAGSIGSSFIRAVCPYKPAELYVVDTNENSLTELTRELRSSGRSVPERYLSYPMDYDSMAFRRMFRAHKGFDIAANFAAHKHVRSEKDIYSIEALLRNNVINAKRLLDLLTEYPPQTYFCVSTDKAADPVNIMGASKRIMEDLIFSYSNSFPVKTARFANAAFSNGSLPDGFLKRFALFQPISAPSDVKRYFVSPGESGQICMLAAMLGENRDIFFPKLDKESMATFEAIARDFLAAHGYAPLACTSDEEAAAAAEVLRRQGREDKIYPVHFSVSDTSGEKVFEEFYVEGETVDMTRFKALGVITGKPVPDRCGIEDLIKTLEEAFERPDCCKQDIVKIISAYLPNFEHLETWRSLDEKM